MMIWAFFPLAEANGNRYPRFVIDGKVPSIVIYAHYSKTSRISPANKRTRIEIIERF
jgi:hypothetical protein